jgi:hypothetical protein
MLTDRESLVKEIERLEKEMEAQHFRGLFDHKTRHQKEKRLKKLRRELAELDGTVVHLEPFRKLESEPAAKTTAKPPAPIQPARRTQEAQAAKKTSPPAPPARKPAGAAKPSTKAAASSKTRSGGATRTTAKKPARPASKTGKKK